MRELQWEWSGDYLLVPALDDPCSGAEWTQDDQDGEDALPVCHCGGLGRAWGRGLRGGMGTLHGEMSEVLFV